MKAGIYFFLILTFIISKILNSQSYVSVEEFHPLGVHDDKKITQMFGGRHEGIDIDGALGDNIYAWRSGVIVEVTFGSPTAGNTVKIQHANNFDSRYLHLYKINVKKGEYVKAGHVIGLMGNTGRVKVKIDRYGRRLGDGSHLHFEVIKYARKIDPYPFLSRLGNSFSNQQYAEKNEQEIERSKNERNFRQLKRIVIDSNPSGKIIYLDGVYAGSTPQSFDLYVGDEHQIKISGDNEYKTHIEKIEVDDKISSRLEIKLVRKPGYLARRDDYVESDKAGSNSTDLNISNEGYSNKISFWGYNFGYLSFSPISSGLAKHISRASGYTLSMDKFISFGSILRSGSFTEFGLGMINGDLSEGMTYTYREAFNFKTEEYSSMQILYVHIGLFYALGISKHFHLVGGLRGSIGSLNLSGNWHYTEDYLNGRKYSQFQNEIARNLTFIDAGWETGAKIYLGRIMFYGSYYKSFDGAPPNFKGYKFGLLIEFEKK